MLSAITQKMMKNLTRARQISAALRAGRISRPPIHQYPSDGGQSGLARCQFQGTISWSTHSCAHSRILNLELAQALHVPPHRLSPLSLVSDAGRSNVSTTLHRFYLRAMDPGSGSCTGYMFSCMKEVTVPYGTVRYCNKLIFYGATRTRYWYIKVPVTHIFSSIIYYYIILI